LQFPQPPAPRRRSPRRLSRARDGVSRVFELRRVSVDTLTLRGCHSVGFSGVSWPRRGRRLALSARQRPVADWAGSRSPAATAARPGVSLFVMFTCFEPAIVYGPCYISGISYFSSSPKSNCNCSCSLIALSR
jgi:hypothetical protein